MILSNHGGRQLEDARAPIEVLPEVAAHVPAPLMLDSGVRRGSDVVKALALGAQAVLLGRAVLYGLAAGGEEGASHVLQILRTELDTTLALIGCLDAAHLAPQYVTGPCGKTDSVGRLQLKIEFAPEPPG